MQEDDGKASTIDFTSDVSGASGDGAHICLLGKLGLICCFHELLPSLVWVEGKCARLYGKSQRWSSLSTPATGN
jgi:hypothetical protein